MRLWIRLQLTLLAAPLILQRIVLNYPFEKDIPALRARRFLRGRSTVRTPLFGPMNVLQIVTPVDVFERGRKPVRLVLNSLPVCLTLTTLVPLILEYLLQQWCLGQFLVHPPSNADLRVVRIVGSAKPLSVTNRNLPWV